MEEMSLFKTTYCYCRANKRSFYSPVQKQTFVKKKNNNPWISVDDTRGHAFDGDNIPTGVSSVNTFLLK